MPCSSSDGMGSPSDLAGDALRQVNDLKRKNDNLTRMLCSLLRALNDVIELPPDIVSWYEAQKAAELG